MTSYSAPSASTTATARGSAKGPYLRVLPLPAQAPNRYTSASSTFGIADASLRTV
jgi:hypothetical protein